MASDFRRHLKERVLIFDGAMGTSIQDRNLTPDDFDGKDGCNEVLVLTKPQVIREIHAGFLDVGCDAVETDSFGASRLVLGEYGLAEQANSVLDGSRRATRSALTRTAGRAPRRLRPGTRRRQRRLG